MNGRLARVGFAVACALAVAGPSGGPFAKRSAWAPRRRRAVPNRDEACSTRLDAIAEANAQFHWGTTASEIITAAINLLRLGINPDLASALQVKAHCIERQICDDHAMSSSVAPSRSDSS